MPVTGLTADRQVLLVGGDGLVEPAYPGPACPQ
jgi:hypothetical protein